MQRKEQIPGGVIYVCLTFAKIVPSSRTMPTPNLFALPSIPSEIILTSYVDLTNAFFSFLVYNISIVLTGRGKILAVKRQQVSSHFHNTRVKGEILLFQIFLNSTNIECNKCNFAKCHTISIAIVCNVDDILITELAYPKTL